MSQNLQWGTPRPSGSTSNPGADVDSSAAPLKPKIPVDDVDPLDWSIYPAQPDDSGSRALAPLYPLDPPPDYPIDPADSGESGRHEGVRALGLLTVIAAGCLELILLLMVAFVTPEVFTDLPRLFNGSRDSLAILIMLGSPFAVLIAGVLMIVQPMRRLLNRIGAMVPPSSRMR